MHGSAMIFRARRFQRAARAHDARNEDRPRHRRPRHRPTSQEHREPSNHRRVHAHRQRSGGRKAGRRRPDLPPSRPRQPRPAQDACPHRIRPRTGLRSRESGKPLRAAIAARHRKGDTRQHAINYATLRSMQRATYSPEDEGHYALASDCYCHFTSPIRRYPTSRSIG